MVAIHCAKIVSRFPRAFNFWANGKVGFNPGGWPNLWVSRCMSTQPPLHHPPPPPLFPRSSNWKKTGKGNIFLMGSPGSGKTTLARMVGTKLGMPSFDIDDDYLEKRWRLSVAEKLKNVGGEMFVLEEGDALMQLEVENSVVSLSGSNPLHQQSMQHVQQLGIVVYIDVQQSDILKRLHEMKVDRIVGQTDGTPMSDILQYRQQFYENYYDIRVLCRAHESLESVANKISDKLLAYDADSDCVSTRGLDCVGFGEAVLQGLANDGGLFVRRQTFPRVGFDEWTRLVPLSYAERALRILEMLISPRDIHPSQLRQYVAKVFSDENFDSGVCRVVPMPDKPRAEFLLELFHGPTGSFKDLALQLMPHIFHHASQSQSELSKKTRYLMLVATSGDTGSAVAHGFQSFVGDGSLKVLVLYPENGVSPVQKFQMLSAQSEHVSVVGVDGDFDFCQTTVKSILTDQNITKQLISEFDVKLSAANSINWARLLAQMVYHISGYLDLVAQNVIHMGQEIDVAVPTGNFGNIMSALYARSMGLPIRKLICASNSNNILTEFINTGHYHLSSRQLKQTSSPAIDILRSSNLERYIFATANRSSDEVCRLYHELNETGKFRVSSRVQEAMKDDFLADWCMESSCLDCIRETYEKTGYLLDPHTAVAMAVSKKFQSARGEVPLLICSTAHYAKFPSTVLQALGKDSHSDSPLDMMRSLEELNASPALHNRLRDMISSSTVAPHSVLSPSLSSVMSHIKSLL